MRHTRIRVPVMHERFGRVDLAPVAVRDKAHEILKRCMIEGRLAPGQRLIIILEASGNQTRGNLLRLLRDWINHYCHLTIATPGRGREAAKELVALLKFLRRGDQRGAARTMRQHVLRAGECMIPQLNVERLNRGGPREGPERLVAGNRTRAVDETRKMSSCHCENPGVPDTAEPRGAGRERGKR